MSQVPPIPTGDQRSIRPYIGKAQLQLYVLNNTVWCSPGTVNGSNITKTEPNGRGENIGSGTGDVWVECPRKVGRTTSIKHGGTGSMPESNDNTIYCKIGSYKTVGGAITCSNSAIGPLAMFFCRNYRATSAPYFQPVIAVAVYKYIY